MFLITYIFKNMVGRYFDHFYIQKSDPKVKVLLSEVYNVFCITV